MKQQTTGRTSRSPTIGNIVPAIIALAAALFCIYYYLHAIQTNTSTQVSSQVFYLILILFGVCVSILIFSLTRSYAQLKGTHLGARYRFSGPVVGVILVVLGGFYLPKPASAKILSVMVVGKEHVPVGHGKVTLHFSNFSREVVADDNGQAVFPGVTTDDLANPIRFDVERDGYQRIVFDTLLKGPQPIEVTLSPINTIQVSGTVTDANDLPISDVEVMVESSRFSGRTISNGSFSFDIIDYSIGNEINLVTSHRNYRDKTTRIRIHSQKMKEISIVLAPLK
jgi:uncharacterized membrane protein HdeD (DUF308 family)